MKYSSENRFQNVPEEFRYSREWTDRDRLHACVIMAYLIAEDATAGRYSAVDRPNATSIAYMASLPASEIEAVRDEIERITWEHFNPSCVAANGHLA